jgi:hypothetical protein
LNVDAPVTECLKPVGGAVPGVVVYRDEPPAGMCLRRQAVHKAVEHLAAVVEHGNDMDCARIAARLHRRRFYLFGHGFHLADVSGQPKPEPDVAGVIGKPGGTIPA